MQAVRVINTTLTVAAILPSKLRGKAAPLDRNPPGRALRLDEFTGEIDRHGCSFKFDFVFAFVQICDMNDLHPPGIAQEEIERQAFTRRLPFAPVDAPQAARMRRP